MTRRWLAFSFVWSFCCFPSLMETHGLDERHEWLLKQTIGKAQTASTLIFSIFSEQRGAVKGHSVAIRHTRLVTFSFQMLWPFQRQLRWMYKTFCTNPPRMLSELKWSWWSSGLHCAPQSGALLCEHIKNSDVLGCAAVSFSLTGVWKVNVKLFNPLKRLDTDTREMA